MDPWLHSLSRSLTLRDLAAPFIDVPCRLDDRLENTLQLAKAHLMDQSAFRRVPRANRACIRIPSRAEDHVLLLDSCLASESWAADCAEDDSPVSLYARPVEACQFIDSAATFLEGMARLEEVIARRSPDSEADAPAETSLFPRDFLIVLNRGRWHGIVAAEHFTDAPPVRAAIWAMLLEIEQAVVSRTHREPEGVLEALPPARLEKAMQEARRKRSFLFDWKTPADLWTADPELRLGRAAWIVSASLFIDKLTIATRRGWCMSELSKSTTGRLCARLDKLRNWCCHSDFDESDYTLSELIELTRAAQEVLMQILRWDTSPIT